MISWSIQIQTLLYSLFLTSKVLCLWLARNILFQLKQNFCFCYGLYTKVMPLALGGLVQAPVGHWAFGLGSVPHVWLSPTYMAGLEISLEISHTSLLEGHYGLTLTSRSKIPAPTGRAITPRTARCSQYPRATKYFIFHYSSQSREDGWFSTPWLCTPTAGQRHFTAPQLWESSPKHLIQTKRSCPVSCDCHWHFHEYHTHWEKSHFLLITILELVENTGNSSFVRWSGILFWSESRFPFHLSLKILELMALLHSQLLVFLSELPTPKVPWLSFGNLSIQGRIWIVSCT